MTTKTRTTHTPGRMTKAPKDITPATLDCVVMPNGEIICSGKSVGWIKELGRFLTPQTAASAAAPELRAALDAFVAFVDYYQIDMDDDDAGKAAEMLTDARALLARIDGAD